MPALLVEDRRIEFRTDDELVRVLAYLRLEGVPYARITSDDLTLKEQLIFTARAEQLHKALRVQ